MTQIAWIDLAQILDSQGFPRGVPLVNGLAVIGAETAGKREPMLVNTAGNTPPSRDRGLWMINDYWHPEVSDDCAFDPVCSTKEAFRISKGGTDYSEWSSWNNGGYEHYLPEARVALDALSRITKLTTLLATTQTQLLRAQDDLSASYTKGRNLQAEIDSLNIKISGLTTDEESLQAQLMNAQTMAGSLKIRAETAEGALKRAQDNLQGFFDDQFHEIFG